jgi:hypothetical protein
MSEDEIKALMAREIVEDVCDVLDGEEKVKCRRILHRILVAGESFESLYELSEDSRRKLRIRFEELLGGR